MATTEVLIDEHWQAITSPRYAQEFRQALLAPHKAPPRGLIAAPGLSAPARRALGISSAVSAGYLAPIEFSRRIWRAMTASSAVRASCTVQESSGNEQAVAFMDDTSNLGRILPEHEVTTETDPIVGLKKIKTYTFSSDVVRASLQLIQDVGGDVFEEYIVTTLAERVARLLNWTCTTGSLANEPEGLATAAAVGVTGGAGQTATVTYADLVALKGSVGTAYVYGPTGMENRARWMMHRSTFEAIQGLKDGGGLPIWKGDDEGKTPGTLLNHRIVVNDDVSSMAASAKSVLFGDFGRYVLLDAPLVVTILRERYAEAGQVGYHVSARHGAQLIDPAAIRAYQNAAA